jgi:hypothetical protein
MKLFDPLHQVGAQRDRRFADHAPSCVRRLERRAVEAKPDGCIDQRSATIDKIGDPESAVAEIDRRLMVWRYAQKLPLNHGSKLRRCANLRLEKTPKNS